MCIEEKVIIRLTFNPGSALTGFRTILPCFQQINLTWARNPIENQHLVSGQLQKKQVTSMSWKLEPVIKSCDTCQQIPCFDRCQLIITWMSTIKEVQSKPRLHVSVNLLFGLWPPCCTTVAVAVVRTCPWAIPLTMITMRKSIQGFPFLSYMSMGLRLVVLRAAGAPLTFDLNVINYTYIWIIKMYSQ